MGYSTSRRIFIETAWWIKNETLSVFQYISAYENISSFKLHIWKSNLYSSRRLTRYPPAHQTNPRFNRGINWRSGWYTCLSIGRHRQEDQSLPNFARWQAKAIAAITVLIGLRSPRSLAAFLTVSLAQVTKAISASAFSRSGDPMMSRLRMKNGINW